MVGPESYLAEQLHTFDGSRFGAELRIIGEGQHATVYEGFDDELGRRVAIKIAREDTIADDFDLLGKEAGDMVRQAIHDIVRQRQSSTYTLLREARLAAAVHHPGVVSVLEVGRFAEDGCVVVVMPLLRGAPLRCTAPWRSILDSVLQLAGGLAALHEAGIVHRDLKPTNILYNDRGRPCIADLGLACELSDEVAMKDFVGSATWMAPEVLALRKGSGIANDIFALCMIAFEMFYGHPPFVGEDAKAEGRISDIKRGDDMPDALRGVLVKGLDPDPASRWSSVRELIAALEEIEWQLPVKPPRPPRRRWLGGAAAAGLSVGLGVGMWVTLPEAKADACEEVSRELVDFWNDEVRTELRVVLGTRKASDYLESFASRWVAVRASECEAAKRAKRPQQASPCSASVRDHFNATIAALRSPHQRAGLDHETILAELPSPEHCIEHPEDAEHGRGGVLELRTLDIEIRGRLAGGDLEVAEHRQADYMAAARRISSLYDIARAIRWRGELHRLRGELDEAEADFKRAYAEAMELRALEFSGEVMLELVAVAGSKGEFGLLDERAFLVRTAFARRPDKIAELLQVQGLALALGDPTQRDRGIALLRDALAMREAEHSRFRGPRDKVGAALEALARGLLAAEQADEAVMLAKQSLAVHELEHSSNSKRAHELRRLLFVAQVNASLLDGAQRTLGLLVDPLHENRDFRAYLDEALWAVEVCFAAGRVEFGTNLLTHTHQMAATHGIADLEQQAELLLRRRLEGKP